MSDTRFDHWLDDRGPAALVIREYLMPVDGDNGVIFPATFAAGDTFKGGYNIDSTGENLGENVCLIDTVGSQANRIEPLFAKADYQKLVPQIIIQAGEKQVNLLEAGHRAGDAVIRCTELQADVRKAFESALRGDVEPLAKIAPTSLVFGVWDSRDTQAKLQRLVSSTIRAFNVRTLTRSAQFNPAVDYIGQGLLEATDDKKRRDEYAQRGFVHVPASAAHGGVIANGGIRRDAILGLAALRSLKAATPERTRDLQRYILGLALTAFTARAECHLRQGCILVLDPEKPRSFDEVGVDGQRRPVSLGHDDATAYAAAVAGDFGVGPNRTVNFDNKRAVADLDGTGEGAPKRKKKAAKQ